MFLDLDKMNAEHQLGSCYVASSAAVRVSICLNLFLSKVKQSFCIFHFWKLLLLPLVITFGPLEHQQSGEYIYAKYANT